MRHAEKVRLCAVWLQKCLEFGWSRDDLPWLEDLWWKYDAWRFQR